MISMFPLAAIVAFLAFRHTGNGDEKVTPPPPDPVLSRIVPKADFNGTGLGEVLQSLSDQTKVPILVDWRKLEMAGINSIAPVIVHRSEAALGEVLNAVLSDAGGRTVKLSYTAVEGEIAVTDLESIASVLICRIYDIADLVDELEVSKWPASEISWRAPRFRWQPPGECLPDVSGIDVWIDRRKALDYRRERGSPPRDTPASSERFRRWRIVSRGWPLHPI